MLPVSKKRSRTQNKRGVLKEIILSTLVSTLMLAGYFAASVILVQKEMLQLNHLRTVSRLGLFLATLIGTLICAKRVKRGKLVCAMETGFAICLILAVAGLTMGEKEALSFGPAALILGSASILGGMLGARGKRFEYV